MSPSAGRRQHRERPLSLPARGVDSIDAPGRFGEQLLAAWGQPVFAAPPMARGREPAFRCETGHRGSHQPLGEAEGPREIDQAAECHGPAAGRNGIPEEGDEERAAAQRPLALKAPQQRLERFRERWHSRHSGMEKNVTQKMIVVR